MNTTYTVKHIQKGKIILALLCVCVISDANAFKCRTYMFPESVSVADRIVLGTVEFSNSVPLKDRFAITNLIDAAGLNSGFKEVHYSENQYCLSGYAVNTRREDKVFPKQKPAICCQTKDKYDD